MSKKDGKINKSINSIPEELINKRFMAKISVFDNGVDEKSVLVLVRDLLEVGFTIKFFKTEDEAVNLLKLLNSV